MEVTLLQMLDARERRALRQQQLLKEYGCTLLCFTMNIAGPVKNSPLISRGFERGKRLLDQQLMVYRARVLHFEQIHEVTGCEAIYVLSCDPITAKKAAVAIEDGVKVGRLFDMDVLKPDGSKVDRQELGLESRKCLICGGRAADCGRSRTHTVEQLQAKTTELLTEELDRYEAKKIASLACRALLYEVGATPKPGLVDRDNSGSHRDMDFFTFQSSAAALWPYFETCAAIGMETRDLFPETTFDRLRTPGLLAEGEMLRATGGVNTHKGAVFSLGILCAALGRMGPEHYDKPEFVLYECGQMTQGLVERDFAGLTKETAVTAGQKLYLERGITGVRGQAEAGFPAVLKAGLPKLEEALAAGYSLNDAGCAALIAMLAASVDTNLISRGSFELQQQIAVETAIALFREPIPGREMLLEMDRKFIEKNLSPGGTADLLAMVYLLHFMKEDAK